MMDYLHLLLTLGAVGVVLLGIMVLSTRFVVAPLAALGALPTYAGMIGIEGIVRHYFGTCPKFLQFFRPKTFWKRVTMDAFASYCTVVGYWIAAELFQGALVGRTADAGLATLITRASDSGQFPMFAAFWIFLVGVYAVSNFQKDNAEHPMNKLEDLVMPEWAKKLLDKIKP